MPGRREGRGRLTEGEAGELDEQELGCEIGSSSTTSSQVRRIKGEVGLTEGTNHAVFSRGARIDGERHTGTGRELITVTIGLAQVTVPSRLTLDAAVERGVDAHITTQLDAGVGARNVEETGTI